MARPPKSKDIEALRHKDTRINNPTAEMAPIFEQNEELLGATAQEMRLPRAFSLAEGETRQRDPDLDPQIIWNGIRITLTEAQRQQLWETGEVEIGDAQLVWRGKDTQDWSDLVVNAPPLYIQEKVHPKAIIDDLKRRSDAARAAEADMPDLFADFNGLTDPEDRYEFYRHSMHWQNRFILGDSLQVMASLAQREGLKGKVQAIYFDPPYGIKFNSNWQVSTLSRDVKDGKATDITREPEQVKAFRDTWKDGIHSYLTYLRDRLTVARELLTESGSIFVQIGDENVHRVRAVMDEVFGAENFCADIVYQKTVYATSSVLPTVHDYVLWYARDRASVKYRPLRNLLQDEDVDGAFRYFYVDSLCGPKGGSRLARQYSKDRLGRFMSDNITSPGPSSYDDTFEFEGERWRPGGSLHWKTNLQGLMKLAKAGRIFRAENSLRYCKLPTDAPALPIKNIWTDTTVGSFAEPKTYIVQTTTKVAERCLLMTTDPGDLVLDPTCGSGTTADLPPGSSLAVM